MQDTGCHCSLATFSAGVDVLVQDISKVQETDSTALGFWFPLRLWSAASFGN